MKEKRLIVLMLFALLLVNYLDRVNISVAGSTMMRELSIDPLSFGLILSAFTIGYALVQIPGGYLADRFGAKPLLVITPLLWSIFTFGTGIASTVTTLVVVRVLFGLCEGTSNSALYRMLGDAFEPTERSKATSRVALGIALGPALAAPLVSWVLLHSSWHYVFFLSALPGLVLALGMYFMLPDRRMPRGGSEAHATAPTGGWGFLARPATWVLFAAYLLFNVGFWGYIGWMPSYLVIDRHVDIKALGFGASIPYVFGAAGLIVFGALGSGVLFRWRGMLSAACALGAAISLTITFYVSTLDSAVAGLSAAAFFLYGVFGPYASVLLDLAPATVRGSFAGVINTGGQIGGAIAPVAVGSLVKWSGNFATGFAFMVSALVVSTICFASLSPALRKAYRPAAGAATA